MIDLTKINLPSSVEVGGRFYHLHTDFQFWINFAIQIDGKSSVNVTDFDFVYDGEIPFDRHSAFQKLLEFAFPKKEIPRSVGGPSVRMLDYVLDSDLIYSAFVEQYGIDLLDDKLHLHWYKFQSLLSGLHNTKLNDIMGYRSFDENKKADYKKDMKELKRSWELQPKIDEQTQKDLDSFNALFK